MKEKEKNYLSPEGYQNLSREFEQLWQVERPQLTQMIAWAASNGDRSENADYIYGKRRLREIDRRLNFLRKRLELAIVVEKQDHRIPLDKIQFGAKVTVRDEEDQEKIYIIVGVDEINLQLKRISWKSPLGNALLGKKVGDTVLFQSPQGEVELEIIRVEY